MFTRPGRKTLVFHTIRTVCSTKMVYYIRLLCVKYGMHAYAGRAYICRMYAPSTRYNYSSATYLTFFFSACVDALVSNES